MKKDGIAKLVSVFLFLSVCITAPADENLQDENVIVDSRPLSPEQRALMEQKRLEEQQLASSEIDAECIDQHDELEYQENNLGDGSNSIKTNEIFLSEETEQMISGVKIPIKTREFINQTAAPVYSPYIYHTIHSFPQETIIKLEDGSEWMFDPKDSYIVRSWRARSRDSHGNENQPDTVVISPKSSWFSWFSGSNYTYVLQNKDLGSSIDVNPFLGPYKDGEFTTWVIGIDYNLGQIYVTNGQKERSVWEISSSDFYLFKDWNVNDTIIVGENNSWVDWFSSYNHILINVNSNHYVRARQVSVNHFPKPREAQAPGN